MSHGLEERDLLTPESVAGGLLPQPRLIPHTPAALDASRVLHRLMKYWIYYFRHVDPNCLPAELRDFADVSSDECGEY